MTVKQRFDYVMFKATKDDNGFLVDTPVVARVGLQEYTLPDGTIQREFRPRGEVFAWDSLASYQGKPITLGHVIVTPENAKSVTVGNCSGRAFADEVEGKVMCPVTIMDSEAIEAAEAGEANELSVGYGVIEIHENGWGSNVSGEYIFTKDITQDYVIPSDWVEFDVLQTQIRVNHLAMVKRGRAGVARLNLDGSEEIKYIEDESTNKEESIMTVKIKLDGAKEFDVPEEVATHITTLGEQVTAANKKADSLEAERDVLKVKVDGIPAEIEAALAAQKVKADELAELVVFATEAGIKCDGLDAKGIKVAYLKEVGGVEAADKNDAYIDNAFDFARASDKMASQRSKINGDKGATKSDEQEVKLIDPQARFRK